MATNYNTYTSWANLQANKRNLLSLGNIEYQYFQNDWVRILDVVDGGEREVKERGTEYLPKTSGMKANTSKGDEVYEAYKTRAVFYGYARDTLPAMLGVMHAKQAKFELPTAIEFMNQESSDPQSWRVGLQQILRETNRNQLSYGRYGLLADIPAFEQPVAQVRPKIIGYEAFFILDWSTRESESGEVVIDYVLLAEEKPEDEHRRAKYTHPDMRLRLLALDAEGNYYYMLIDVDPSDLANNSGSIKILETLGNIDLDNPPVEDPLGGSVANYPLAAGQPMKFIPFVFVNVTNLYPDVQKSPLLQLSNMDISIYRGDADWAQAYFLQGQATPVFSGVSEGDEVFVGAGGGIKMSDPEAKAYYMEVSGDGLEEMRERQQALQNFATSLGIALVDQNQPESGKALETRTGIKSAPLKTVAITGAKALQQALRYAAFWTTGEFDIDNIIVTPNLDFSTSTKAAKELLDLFMAKQAGAPISMRDLHKFARDNNFSDKDYEETLQDIQEEE